jgi:hypothetical protein
MEGYPFSAARDYLFNTFAATLHYLKAASSIRYLRTPHTMVTKDPPDIGATDSFLKLLIYK